MHFLPASDPTLMQFIFATEETGYRHLYLYTVQMAASVSKNMANEGNMLLLK